MKIDIVTKNISLDDALEVFVKDKIGGLEKMLPAAAASARVEIGKTTKHHRTGPVFYAEANVTVAGKLVRADATHVDLRAAIVDVKDALKIELKKVKEKDKDVSRRKGAKE